MKQVQLEVNKQGFVKVILNIYFTTAIESTTYFKIERRGTLSVNFALQKRSISHTATSRLTNKQNSHSHVLGDSFPTFTVTGKE